MSGRNMAWTTAAATGFVCAVTAASAAWLLLTQPVVLTSALDGQNAGAVVHALVTALIKAASVLHLL
jgi:hypothetical protein